MIIRLTTVLLLLLFMPLAGQAQKVSDQAIKRMIETYKKDPKGPYKYLRWFCFDGRINPPKEPCGDNQGVQRAAYKDEVESLAETNHVFLGQILANTSKAAFWDAENNHSRLKQYQLEQFLKAADDGWVLRRGQYYRGAFQAEDEEAWGIDFFDLLLEEGVLLQQNFFMIRQAARVIPHAGDNDRTQEMRAVSKSISESFPRFMNLRVKIHGQPDASDIPAVEAFLENNRSRLNQGQRDEFAKLLEVMEEVYKPIDLRDLEPLVQKVSPEAPIQGVLQQYIDNFADEPPGRARVIATAERIWEIRQAINEVEEPGARLALIDLSNRLEVLMMRDLPSWRPGNLHELLDQICHQSQAAAGAGFLEAWEWNAIASKLAEPANARLGLDDLTSYLETARSVVEWGTGMTRAVFGDVVELYIGFEPLAAGFEDDLIRSSVLLPLGQNVGRLSTVVTRQSAMANQVLDLRNQGTIRGLNAGYALGELVVITGPARELDVSPDKIYVMEHPPSDLKPVAGIATVSEGNMVSHVQLLARNLGIPNGVVSIDNVEQLKRYAGQEIFYAVSNKGRVIMKLAGQMTAEEKDLFTTENREQVNTRVSIPVDQLKLEQTTILDMRDVDADDSGELCGPKAANLGQLKAMFPEMVVEGFVIPFGIFRAHLDQDMPGEGSTYWDFLNSSFEKADQMRADGKPENEVESYTLAQLGRLRNAILNISLLPSFEDDLENSFKNILGGKIGEVPVFLRSDTNMEDLAEFTGAGLNLTVFNVADREKIIEGIKKVWASPYTERSFKWRQKYLLNPENVFPSILVIPGVNNDCSGVMITKGVTTGEPDDVTIAFSRGVGGAVDGQRAESYLLKSNGENVLLSPAREPVYKSLPDEGGTIELVTTFERRLLTPYHLAAIRDFVPVLKRVLPSAPGIETEGPFDVELGFKDNKLWLFQARPFVENKNASVSTYLESLDPEVPAGKMVNLNTNLGPGD